MLCSQMRHEKRYMRRRARRNKNKAKLTNIVDSFEYAFEFYWFMNYSLRVCNGVRWKESVQRFEMHIATNCIKTKERIKKRTWRPRRASHFLLFDAGKLRQIDSVNIHTRAVQCTLCFRCLVPIAERSSIADNYACRTGKGTHAAIKALARMLKKAAKEGTFTIWLFDFSKFFASFLHAPLFAIIKEYLNDTLLIYLITELFKLFGIRGLQLGSHFSQVATVLFGTKIDNYIKGQLHVNWYGRYSDDGFIISKSSDMLYTQQHAIAKYCTTYGLSLNQKKSQCYAQTDTITFLKKRFTIYDGRCIIRLRSKAIGQTRRKLKRMLCNPSIDITQAISAYNAWTSFARKYNSYKTRIAMLNYMRKNLDERMIAYEVKRNFMLKLRD